MKVGAVILAAGNGGRFGADVPKQFVNLNGKPIIGYALDTFVKHPEIAHIVLVLPKGVYWKVKPEHEGRITAVTGGATRRESSYIGIGELPKDCTHVLVHDAARPFVSGDIISRCIYALRTHDAVDVSIPSADTIIQVDAGGATVELVPDRRRMRLGQTPQGFECQHILDAHRAVPADAEVTDDIGLLRIFDNGQLKFLIANVTGEERNMKITRQSDLIKAERYAMELPDRPVTLNVGNALIFGGTGGIGSEVVKLLRDDPCPVTMIWGREQCDISGRHDALSKIGTDFLDYVVISVGVLHKMAAEDWEAWEGDFDMNFTHVARFLMNLKQSGVMRKGASIVVVGSSSAYRGRAGTTAYSAAKAALQNFVQGLAEEWNDVRINIVNPARTDTKMRRKAFPDEDKTALCSAEYVALRIVRVLGMQCTGCVFDVRANGVDC